MSIMKKPATIEAGAVRRGEYWYPQLVFPKTGVKQTDTRDPLINRKTALKYAHIWRNERLKPTTNP